MHRSTNVTVSCALILAVLLAPRGVSAQVVRGTVVDATQRGIGGAVVALIDSSEAVVARALTDDDGSYRITAPRSGTYRLRTLRVGYQPHTSPPRVLAAGAVEVVPLVVDGVRVSLATMRVVDRSVCGRGASTGEADVFSAWEQAMTSIAEASLTASARGLTATTFQVERRFDATGRRLRAQSLVARTENVTQPWRSRSADQLRRVGYVELESNEWLTYHAPGLDVLMSPPFLEDHCLRIVAAQDTSEVGVRFEPIPQRWRRSEIRGTLWLSRNSAVLRRLEFEYVGGAAPANGTAGGSMRFGQLQNGGAVIASWEIRMPEMLKDTPRSPARLDAIVTAGGELVVLRRGTDTLFRQPTVNLSGTVLDSVSGRGIVAATVAVVGTTRSALSNANGEFTIRDLLPGEYLLNVRTPALDSMRTSSQSTATIVGGMAPLRLRIPTPGQVARAMCGTALSGNAGRMKGGILGTVHVVSATTRDTTAVDGISGADTLLRRASSSAAGIRVVADWTETVFRTQALDQLQRRMETRTDSTGAFRLCGVPTEQRLTVRAMPDRGRSEAVSAALSPDERFATVALTVDRDQQGTAALRGTVVTVDSTQASRPVADAEVSIPALARVTRSNARGEYRLDDIPTGEHEVQVRRVGYGAIVASLAFVANSDNERRMVLRPLTVLDSIEVLADAIPLRLREFEEHRRLGLGHFFVRADFDKNVGRRMGDMLATVPALGLARGGTSVWPMTTRLVPPNSGAVYQPTEAERFRGMVAGCYAHVYVNGQLMNPGVPTEPFDLNTLAPNQIEALEWYAGAAQTPTRYSKLNGNCGVVVVHLR